MNPSMFLMRRACASSIGMPVPKPVSETDPSEPLLLKLTPEVRALMQQLRALVPEVITQVSEKIHLGWGVIHFRTGGSMRDVVAALSPQRNYVNLEFGDGGDASRLALSLLRSIAHAKPFTVRRLDQPAARCAAVTVNRPRGMCERRSWDLRRAGRPRVGDGLGSRL